MAEWHQGGWASERRTSGSPFWLLLCVVCAVGGAGLFVFGVVSLVSGLGPDDEDVVARGTVAQLGAGQAFPTRFVSPREGSYTVWLRTGEGETNRRELVVAGTGCVVAQGDREVAQFRGSRQGTSVTVNSTATVGVFSVGEGRVSVRCGQIPFGRRGRQERVRGEREFLVVRGKPSEGVSGFLWLFAGILIALLSIPFGIIYTAGRLRRR